MDIRKSSLENNWPEEEKRDEVQKCNDKDGHSAGQPIMHLGKRKPFSF